ncbi:lipoprotein [Taibaiella helva]|uniref:lipoprotein n=1 Tax=Taibaiella helva TaxID=2301235 RepID=UPI001300A684|nr:lipoprotein [Taibaiella helva]
MKRILLVLVAGVVLSSCSKTYTCTCTSVLPDGTVTSVEPHSISGTKSGSEDKCKQFDHVVGNITTTCQLN